MDNTNSRLQAIKGMIERGDAQSAIGALHAFIDEDSGQSYVPYYLLGNAYRKLGDWQGAINNYLEAEARAPHCPAASARQMLEGILEFRNKDLYNQ